MGRVPTTNTDDFLFSAPEPKEEIPAITCHYTVWACQSVSGVVGAITKIKIAEVDTLEKVRQIVSEQKMSRGESISIAYEVYEDNELVARDPPFKHDVIQDRYIPVPPITLTGSSFNMER